jgi:DNA-binding NarL/FixJ family response regulator
VIEAEDMTEGYCKVCEQRPDLVVLDISLPDGNGLNLAERIRKELPEVVVAICTTYDIIEYREAAAARGAAYFFAKETMKPDDVFRVVEEATGAQSRGSVSCAKPQSS